MERARVARGGEENEVELAGIVAFSDGVFAIAITLLVLNLSVPEQPGAPTAGDLGTATRTLAFGISFAVIGAPGRSNHRFFRDDTGFDIRL